MLRCIRAEVDCWDFACDDRLDEEGQQRPILYVALELYERSSDPTPFEVMVGPVHVDLKKENSRSLFVALGCSHRQVKPIQINFH